MLAGVIPIAMAFSSCQSPRGHQKCDCPQWSDAMNEIHSVSMDLAFEQTEQNQ